MAGRAHVAKGNQPDDTLVVEQAPNETGARAIARKVLEPHFRHAVTASAFAGKVLGQSIEAPGLMDYVHHELDLTAKAEGGDVSIASRLLAAQAVTLDSMFTELARRMAVNMGDYPDAAERYGKLALKAQSNCRATLDTLAKLHQPREQIVRHVHVNDGGKAVVAENFHHQVGGAVAKSTEQPHAKGNLPPHGDVLNASDSGTVLQKNFSKDPAA